MTGVRSVLALSAMMIRHENGNSSDRKLCKRRTEVARTRSPSWTGITMSRSVTDRRSPGGTEAAEPGGKKSASRSGRRCEDVTGTLVSKKRTDRVL
jgi:hypothetical protein